MFVSLAVDAHYLEPGSGGWRKVQPATAPCALGALRSAPVNKCERSLTIGQQLRRDDWQRFTHTRIGIVVKLPRIAVDLLQLFNEGARIFQGVCCAHRTNMRQYPAKHKIPRHQSRESSMQVSFQEWTDGFGDRPRIVGCARAELHKQTVVPEEGRFTLLLNVEFRQLAVSVRRVLQLQYL